VQEVVSSNLTSPTIQRLFFGPVAQLIERVVRNDEVVGLIPICSTTFKKGRFFYEKGGLFFLPDFCPDKNHGAACSLAHLMGLKNDPDRGQEKDRCPARAGREA
jgi:hypothetical protein